jgi:valyl-tRNA synthetase
MNEKFLKPYNPQETEGRIYEMWEKSGYFNPDVCVKNSVTKADAPTFSIVLPPPNVTGTLHLGHSLMLVIEDILIRRARMQGKRTLWLPGTDHASIATQSKVEKELYKNENKRRHDLGRETFLKRVEQFAQDSHDTIVSQVRSMGASVDWSREAFTLDAKRNHAVRTAFKKMYDDGLIYRGHRIVNWDPKGQTTISDDEIVYKEEKTKFYYFKYGPFTIGTARPETKFGDKHVVMHPDDERYAAYKHGQKIELEWINGPLTATVIKDTSIDMNFGTGVMTITPWHSAVDFEIAERHNLDKEQIIDKYGKLLPIAGEFAGMKITDARTKIVEKLRAKGLVEKEEEYTHNIATAERTDGVIEPQIMDQWFIAVNKPFTLENSKIKGIESGSKVTLKEVMLAAVRNGQTTIIPERFDKTYFNWIENLRDWCISRQIWYGHRVPVWYKKDVNGVILEEYCGVTDPTGPGWEQDEDTLDTWFSSGLWTFSTLGWPDEKEFALMRDYHPTTVLETGYDILFFWVARMILMSGYLLGEIPFKTVYLHGLVRDAQGRKMSKSLGNIIDPVEMANKYGADAVRMSLIIGTGPGNDSKMSEDKIKAYKNFANKMWNVTRFVLTSVDGADMSKINEARTISSADKELLKKLDTTLTEINTDMDNYRFYLAGEKLYHYFWHEFADIIIEESKAILSGADTEAKISRQHTLLTILTTSLKALHPFMPFVTEEIWQNLPQTPGKKEQLMIETWPEVRA